MINQAETYENVLMRTLQFKENDLTLNRQGKLGEAQIARLKQQRNRDGGISAGLLALLVLGFLLPKYFPIFGWVGLMLMVICVVGLYVTGTRFYQIFQDLMQQCVEKAEGYTTVGGGSAGLNLGTLLSLVNSLQTGTAFSGASWQDNRYVMNVAGTEFEVTKNIANAIKNSEPHRVFYTPNSKHILSIESLQR